MADGRPIVFFFEEVIRREPWIRIRSFPAGAHEPRDVQFKLQCTFEPTRYHWSFGDGDESSVAEPIHVYTQPGDYRVTVAIDDAKERAHRRTLDVRIR